MVLKMAELYFSCGYKSYQKSCHTLAALGHMLCLSQALGALVFSWESL